MNYRYKRWFSAFFLLIIMVIICVATIYNTDKGNDCIRINEICSHNQTVIYDGEGEYSDYIELYNYSNKAIDLSNSQGKILDSVEIPTVDVDKVYARNINNGEWENNQIPTPLSPNEVVVSIEKKVTEDENVIPKFSVEEVYTPDFPVDKCNVVRAVAVSREDGSKHRAITNYSSEGKGWRRDAYVEVFDETGTEQYSEDLKISIHGGWSVLFNQKSFNLLGELEADGTQNYVLSGLFGEKSTSLMLRAGGCRDLYSTKFRDALNHELVADRNLTILRSVPCQVFLNGEYWGMYNLQERIDPGLIENKYGVNAEDVIILKNSNVVGGDDADYQLYADVVKYAETHDLSVEAFYQEMASMIDIQSYIDYYCFQIYVANCDAVANNYSCWRTKTITDEEYYDGKWRWVLYDTDDSLGMVDLC